MNTNYLLTYQIFLQYVNKNKLVKFDTTSSFLNKEFHTKKNFLSECEGFCHSKKTRIGK
jgi:hypothetical protein